SGGVAGRRGRGSPGPGLAGAGPAPVGPAPRGEDEPRLRTIPLAASNIVERSIGIPFPLPAPAAFARLWREVKTADAVHVHDGLYLTSLAAFAAARWLGKAVAGIQHIGPVPYKNPLLRWRMPMPHVMALRPVLA